MILRDTAACVTRLINFALRAAKMVIIRPCRRRGRVSLADVRMYPARLCGLIQGEVYAVNHELARRRVEIKEHMKDCWQMNCRRADAVAAKGV